MKEYIFVPYDSRYPAQFQREKRKLVRILPFANIFEHFGSTSAKGLSGKGVIDVYVIVHKSDFKKSREGMENEVYVYHGTKEREGGFSMVFRKSYVYRQNIRTANIHIGTQGLQDFATVINFRDSLRKSKKLCREYESVKKEAVRKMKNGGEFTEENTCAYVEAKSDFISKQRKVS